MSLPDRSFLTDGRPYLNSRQAAEYCGFEPGDGKADPQMRSFHTWCYRRRVFPLPGRHVFARADLDRAMQQKQDEPDDVRAARARARGVLEAANDSR